MGTCIHCVRLSCALQRVRLPFPGENQTAHADIQNASAPELWTVEVLPEKLKQETAEMASLHHQLGEEAGRLFHQVLFYVTVFTCMCYDSYMYLNKAPVPVGWLALCLLGS